MHTLLKTLVSDNAPALITGASIPFTRATFYGIKSFSISGLPVYNTNEVKIGVNSGEMFDTIATGSYLTWDLDGKGISSENLSNIWVNGKSADGVYAIWY
jgi:hypothetical protein